MKKYCLWYSDDLFDSDDHGYKDIFDVGIYPADTMMGDIIGDITKQKGLKPREDGQSIQMLCRSMDTQTSQQVMESTMQFVLEEYESDEDEEE